MFIVTVDCGTTNTRVRVWQGDRVLAEAGEPVGIRDVAKSGHQGILIGGIKKTLDRALGLARVSAEQDYVIVASGMITSDIGLCHLPHLRAPVTLAQLAAGAVARPIPEISSQPIWFIPGIKNAVDEVRLDNCDAMDMMRGEEVEVFGLLARHAISGPALVILPGSHSKLVKLDERGRIAGCATTVAGELLDVLTHQTLLAHSVQHQFAERIDAEYLCHGADACRRVGIARAGFSVRILDLFTGASANQRANFLLGAALYSDLLTMKHSTALNLTPETNVVIGGKALLCEALALLIAHDGYFTGEVTLIDDVPEQPLSGIGALAVMKEIRRTAVPAPLAAG